MNVISTGKNGRGASRCWRRERLIRLEERQHSFMEEHHGVGGEAACTAVQTAFWERSHLEINENK